MTLDIATVTAVIGVASILVSPIIYLWKRTMARIENIENEEKTKLTEAQIRQLVSDKLDPVKEDIAEAKHTLDKIYNRLLEK